MITREPVRPEPVYRRLRDVDAIERILKRDAFDAPIPYFPPSFLKCAVTELLAPSPDVYFVAAELNGEYAGFAFAHTLGPRLWRKFARSQLTRHPLAVAWILFRLRVLRPLEWRLNRLTRRASPAAANVGVPDRGLDVPKHPGPFTWSPERPDLGMLDQLFVAPGFRGVGIAPGLLRCVESEMAARQVTLVEAHVDSWNVASLRAFLKAGWEAYETSGRDYYLCCHPLGRSQRVHTGAHIDPAVDEPL